MKIFNWINIRLVLMLGLLIFYFHLLQNEMKIEKLINRSRFIGDNTTFIKQETVNKLLIENKENVSAFKR
jgi:cell division protein FtsQ